jgi:hypothetical protein
MGITRRLEVRLEYGAFATKAPRRVIGDAPGKTASASLVCRTFLLGAQTAEAKLAHVHAYWVCVDVAGFQTEIRFTFSG